MEPVEKLVAELRALTPDQLERVTRFVHEIADSPAPSSGPVVSSSVVQQAIGNGWPAGLFTEVIGHIGEDFERPPQPADEVRPAL